MKGMNATHQSFKYAIQGIKDAIKSEPNLSVHMFFAVIALIFAYFFEFSTVEFAILVVTIFLVIILELINTIAEKLVDLHSTKISEPARQIKDIAAAAVLLSTISAVIIGILLFANKLW